MPTYEYRCPNCGGFEAVRPIAQYQEPSLCPECGALSPRAHFRSPAQSGGLFARLVGSDVTAEARYVCMHGRSRAGLCGCQFK